jgi:hypothetical protein
VDAALRVHPVHRIRFGPTQHPGIRHQPLAVEHTLEVPEVRRGHRVAQEEVEGPRVLAAIAPAGLGDLAGELHVRGGVGLGVGQGALEVVGHTGRAYDASAPGACR